MEDSETWLMREGFEKISTWDGENRTCHYTKTCEDGLRWRVAEREPGLWTCRVQRPRGDSYEFLADTDAPSPMEAVEGAKTQLGMD